jgi:hypothetical protein
MWTKPKDRDVMYWVGDEGMEVAKMYVNKGFGSLKKIGEVAQKVTGFVDEVGGGEFMRESVPGYTLLEEAGPIAEQAGSLGAGIVNDQLQTVWDDSKRVAGLVGLGPSEDQPDLAHHDRARHRLGHAHGLKESEARTASRHTDRTSRTVYNAIQDTHHHDLNDLRSDRRSELLRNPLYEGGQHTFPRHGNTLVGDTRSPLDSSYGSRSIYEPYTPYNMFDKLPESKPDVGKRMMDLRASVYADLQGGEDIIAHHGNYGKESMAVVQKTATG